MRKLEIVALKRDIDAVLECIGHAGCFQITDAGDAASKDGGESRYRASLDTLEELRRSLDLKYPEGISEGTHLPGLNEEAALEEMCARSGRIDQELQVNAERAAKLREALEEARVFAGMELPFHDLDRLAFLALRIGRVDPEELPAMRLSLGEKAVVIAVGEKGDIVAVTARKDCAALDSELTRAGFLPRRFSPDFKGLPSELPSVLDRSLAELDAKRASLEREKAELREELVQPWSILAASFAVAYSIDDSLHSLACSTQTCCLEGWAPRDEVGRLAESIAARTFGRVAMRSFSPEELESVSSGDEEVPVLLKRRSFVSSFERMVLSFGTPRYGSIDPTPFVGVFFVLFFAIMFGDLGQGFLIFACSLAMRFGLVPKLAKWKAFAPIGIACGIGSMMMGFLTGSFFTYETAAPILSLMPDGGSGKTLVFFGATLALGVVVNSTGLIINVVDKIRAGKVGEALFAKTGMAGGLFFWWAVSMGVRAILGSRPAWFDVIGLGLPILGLVFEDRLVTLIEGRSGGHQGSEDGSDKAGFFATAVKGFVAVLESVSYFLSNSLSFLRVGAFALSHVVLSFIVFTMGDMVRHRSAAGLVWQLLIVLFGNAIILFLEGLIVAVQIVRLEYYEFLSKFLTETGSPFVPFKFQFHKEQS